MTMKFYITEFRIPEQYYMDISGRVAEIMLGKQGVCSDMSRR
jgi:hypothetical protein